MLPEEAPKMTLADAQSRPVHPTASPSAPLADEVRARETVFDVPRRAPRSASFQVGSVSMADNRPPERRSPW